MSDTMNQHTDADDAPAPITPELDAEAVLLCSLLWAQGDEVAHVVAHLEPRDFLSAQYAELYEVVVALASAGEPHHASRVHATLADTGRLAGRHGELLAGALRTVSTLGIPTLGLTAMARDVLRAAYRRRFAAAAQVQAAAATSAPTDELFDIMVEQGKAMRRETHRLAALDDREQS